MLLALLFLARVATTLAACSASAVTGRSGVALRRNAHVDGEYGDCRFFRTEEGPPTMVVPH